MLLPLLLAACASASGSPPLADPPQQTDAASIEALLSAASTPVVLNVWASWCVPCRSEAPLLAEAATGTAGSVRFVMLDVRDGPNDAARFIDRFYSGAPMEFYADPEGDIPIQLGGTRGVPLTFFFAAGGSLVDIHFGVIDEAALALQLDEISRR